jgi:hypothetical protein
MRGRNFRDMMNQRQEQENVKKAFQSAITQDPQGNPTVNQKMLLSNLAKVSPESFMNYQNTMAKQELAKQNQEMLNLYRGGQIQKMQDEGVYKRQKLAQEEQFKQQELGLKREKLEIDKMKAKQSAKQKSRGKELSSTQIRPFQDAMKAYEDVNNLDTAISKNKDIVGPVSGYRALNPFDEKARNLQAEIDRVRQVVGKALEGGVLRKEDEEKYKKILPTINDHPQVAKHKLKQLRKKMKSDMDIYIKTNKASGYDVNALQSLSPQGSTPQTKTNKPAWAE